MNIFSHLLIKIIKVYQIVISPYLGNNCRYLPTCSEYFIDSLKEYGVVKGTLIGIKRIKNREKVDNSSPLVSPKIKQKHKIFDNYYKFIKASKEYHEKLWEYQYTRDEDIIKWLDSVEITECKPLDVAEIGGKYRDYSVVFEYKPKGDE